MALMRSLTMLTSVNSASVNEGDNEDAELEQNADRTVVCSQNATADKNDMPDTTENGFTTVTYRRRHKSYADVVANGQFKNPVSSNDRDTRAPASSNKGLIQPAKLTRNKFILGKRKHTGLQQATSQSWADVGFNNPYIITPTIDKLAREGVILNQSYVAQSCGPSRAALMAGYYPYRLGFQVRGPRNRMPSGLPLSRKILPQTLKQMGYSTYMVGKWHLGFCKVEYTPTRRGFERFYGFYLAGEDHYNHSNSNGLDLHDDLDPDWSQNGIYSSAWSKSASSDTSKHVI
ncbi:arylsulfatase B-like [Ptychodera flava]|uniref:arylsulfatase B-like n=1 Tax=Ptychodera flava TaxID=63121 RepID=UPI00396A8147